MGKPDIKGKAYFEDPFCFADTCNAVLFEGKEIILPENLAPMPNSVISYDETSEKQRDILMKASIKTDGRCTYMILGIENMNDLDYALVVRDGSYYFGSLSGQVRSMRHANRKNRSALAHDEWLRNFRKDDKLKPVVTMMIMWNAMDWDGPMSLFEMMDVKDPGILSMMNNYELKNIVIPARMTEKDFAKFKSDTGKILKIAKASGSREELAKILQSREYERIDIRAADYISTVLKIKLNTCVEGGKANMCRAMEEIREYEQGRGKKKGLRIGRKQGKKEGLQQGIRNTYLAFKSFNLDDEKAIERTAELYKMSEEEIRQIISQQQELLAG